MVDPWTIFWVVTTFGLYIIIAIRARAGSTEDVYVAGHDVHPIINGMAKGADYLNRVMQYRDMPPTLETV